MKAEVLSVDEVIRCQTLFGDIIAQSCPDDIRKAVELSQKHSWEIDIGDEMLFGHLRDIYPLDRSKQPITYDIATTKQRMEYNVIRSKMRVLLYPVDEHPVEKKEALSF